MRVICESCAAPQPVDWRPGDLCVQCGLAVREEARCFWCAKWAPRGKFCRSCGAGVAAPEHYGAARMLKHMGASVFEIPRLLAELDPELLATHRSLYGAHAAVANALVEQVRWLEQFLYQKHWDAEWEEELIPQLPWPEERFRVYAEASRLETGAVTLSAASTLPRTQALAHLVRIHQGDFRELATSATYLQSQDPTIAAEAALQLSGWRALYCTYTGINRHELIALLRQSPLPEHAAPRLAALGALSAPDYAPTDDPDTDFLIQILARNTRALQVQLDSADPMRRYVAAGQLLRLHEAIGVGPALRLADEEQQRQLLLDVLRLKSPIPALHKDCFALVESSPNPRVRQAAAGAILLARDHHDCLRLLDVCLEETDIIHLILRAQASPETLLEIGRRLIQAGKFSMGQWGWDEAAKPGRMPLSFVEEAYPAASHLTQRELLRFAEMQIEAHLLERSPLERHLIRACFAGAPAEVIGTAWASMHRIQMHRQVGLTVPCELSLDNIAWCWTMPDFLSAVARLMAHPDAVQQTFVRDDFSRFLRTAGPEFFAAAAAYPEECRRVVESAPLADPYTYCLRFAEALQH